MPEEPVPGRDAAGPLAAVCPPEHLAQAVVVRRPYGSAVWYLPGTPRRRVLEVDRRGRVATALRRGPAGAVEAAWTRTPGGAVVGVLPGGAQHPLWGPSDRIVAGLDGGTLLTVSAALDWERISTIPALADPTRLPPGAGGALLNLVAGLAGDHGRPAVRYRGPYATEQLFWALLESFRLDDAPTGLTRFLANAEDAFLAGSSREVPVDWVPAPHERLFLDGGVVVHLRDGVEAVGWEGRTYRRPDTQGLLREGHRVVRPVVVDGRLGYVAGLFALGAPLEDHLVLATEGDLVARPAPAVTAEPDTETPLGAVWTAALAALLPLQATPLLAHAIEAVWPESRVAWGPVVRDLVARRDGRLTLSWALARRYRDESARRASGERRELARRLAREVVGLVGPPVRQAAAGWLAAQPPARQAELLDAGREADRSAIAAQAAAALGRLLDALVAGEALPAPA